MCPEVQAPVAIGRPRARFYADGRKIIGLSGESWLAVTTPTLQSRRQRRRLARLGLFPGGAPPGDDHLLGAVRAHLPDEAIGRVPAVSRNLGRGDEQLELELFAELEQ